jgi:hypothetical protein
LAMNGDESSSKEIDDADDSSAALGSLSNGGDGNAQF